MDGTDPMAAAAGLTQPAAGLGLAGRRRAEDPNLTDNLNLENAHALFLCNCKTFVNHIASDAHNPSRKKLAYQHPAG